MRLEIIGCGDAFGSGGRLQTSYVLSSGSDRLMIDCGATTSIGLARSGLDAGTIPAILISHLHGDHFAGLVWFAMQAQYVGKRTAPLEIIGPPGIEARFNTATEVLFPGSGSVARKFALTFREIRAGTPIDVGTFAVEAFEVEHPSGAPSHALRIAAAGHVFAFSGDTQWTEPLVEAGRNADLYLMECYMFSGAPRYHMAWETIAANLDRIGARRVLLTHMSEAMLARRSEVSDPRVKLAEDGLVIDI